MNDIAIVVPFFNHAQVIEETVAALSQFGLRCWVVNDGSNAAASAVVARIAARESAWLTLVSHPDNRGKGAAVVTGLRAAQAAGATHALQIDADGQHDFGDINRCLLCVRQYPEALILGAPVFNASVPRARRIGRKITNFWVAVNTLSRDIPDAMCGFRVYPLAPILQLASTGAIGSRMAFDPEIVVRAVWHGIPIRTFDTRVNYPTDGVSHFKFLRDNLLISWMHTRLFFGMSLRLPSLLARRWHRRGQ